MLDVGLRLWYNMSMGTDHNRPFGDSEMQNPTTNSAPVSEISNTESVSVPDSMPESTIKTPSIDSELFEQMKAQNVLACENRIKDIKSDVVGLKNQINALNQQLLNKMNQIEALQANKEKIANLTVDIFFAKDK